jgi:ApaG protein
MSCKGSSTVSHGVRVEVSPFYIPEQSDPATSRYVFGYRVRIANQSDRTVQVLSRRWEIVDADGDRKIVEGEGVVGQQPDIAPGEAFVYSSFCPLETTWGTMEGSYGVRAEDGEALTVAIGRFILVAQPTPAGKGA